MKNKRNIPDFSRTRPGKAVGKDLQQKAAAKPVAPPRTNKPQSTIAKGGQRGR